MASKNWPFSNKKWLEDKEELLLSAFDDDLIREIEARIDIVDIISEDCELTRKGGRYWGLCPFHPEKTPSFTVSQERQLYYCFGCHEGGNVFRYVMKRRNLTFSEAMEYLAQKAGIDAERYRRKGTGRSRDREQALILINQAAAEYFSKMLASEHGKTAREYLNSRRVGDESIRCFQIGYAPDEWHSLQQHLLRLGFPGELLIESGLVRKSQKGDNYMDFFRNRIIFPIHNVAGQVVGFGGRIINGEGPKYINSAENRIFSKRRHLFGLYQGRDEIRRINEVILVEGYMDCLALHQHGIKTAVATLGTALTREQAKMIKRLAQRITIMYDGDAAGQKETLKALAVLEAEELEPSVVVLPQGQDPDEIVQAYGKEEFLKFIQNNRFTAIEFKLDSYLKEENDWSWETSLRILSRLFPNIERYKSPIIRDRMLGLMAMKLNLAEREVVKEYAAWRKRQGLHGNSRNRNYTLRNNKKHAEMSENISLQERLLVKMANSPEVLGRVTRQGVERVFDEPILQELARVISDAAERCLPEEVSSRVQQMVFGQEELQSIWARICLQYEGDRLTTQEIEDYLRTKQALYERSRWQRFTDEVKRLESNGDFYSVLMYISKMGTMIHEARKEGSDEIGKETC